MKEFISIIVPVYNVEPYVEKCIESIINQSYKNLEIIIIDDGSIDNSGKICDKFAGIDSRIKVVHKKNGGSASAKNVGLKMATGYYLSFVDSDDFLEKNIYEHMVNQMIGNEADVIQCNYQNLFVNRTTPVISTDREMVLNTSSYLKRFTFDWTCGLLWNKLYKKELFDDIFFEENRKIDDEFFTYQGIMRAKKILLDPAIIYNYRHRESSVMLSDSSKHQILKDRIEFISKRRKRIIKKFPELQDVFNIHYLNSLLLLSKDDGLTSNTAYMIKNLLNEYKKESNNTTIDWRLKYALFKLKKTSIKKLLSRVNEKINIEDKDQYFK